MLVAGDVATAAAWNVLTNDVISFRNGTGIVPPICRLAKSGTQSIPNSTSTAVTFTGGSSTDTDTMFSSGANTRITIKTAGIYQFNLAATYAVSAVGVARIIILVKNGSEVVTANYPFSASLLTRATLSFCDSAIATDYYEMNIYQDAGASLNTSVHFFSAFLIGSTA